MPISEETEYREYRQDKQEDRIAELEEILTRLVCVELDKAEEEGAGIAWDDRVVRCIYCSWQSEDYEDVPRHDPNCPILLGQEILEE